MLGKELEEHKKKEGRKRRGTEESKRRWMEVREKSEKTKQNAD